MSRKSDNEADKAMHQIWAEWFTFYKAHFRGRNVAISGADQMAFYEIAQPIMRALATFRPCPGCDGHECDWAAGVCAYPTLTEQREVK